MATTQDGRGLTITTPLGQDYFLLESFTAVEAISELFHIDAFVLHEEDNLGYRPTVVVPQDIVGKPVTITITGADDDTRILNGMVSRFFQGERNTRFTSYSLEIVPHVWLLTQQSQSRIFQQISVPDILRKVLAPYQVKYELQETYQPRNYCVQYNESDFDFVSRLMEEEGISYHFEHRDGLHKMVIWDTPSSNIDCTGQSAFEYYIKTLHTEGAVDLITSFEPSYRIMTGKVSQWDYNFQLPTNRLDLSKTSRFSYGDNQKLEKYEFPGGYGRLFDGIEKGGGESAAELNKVFNAREKSLKTTTEALDARVETFSGSSFARALTPGYRFELKNHPATANNGKYLLTRVSHAGNQTPSYISNEASGEPYKNSFEAVAIGAGKPQFRPLRAHPKPLVHGSQTAVVVGPAGEEIFTDKYGRVKVQFNWDRDGAVNEGSSCWIRVAQAWAGNKWGTMFIPRIGMEVVVDFLEGDPDQPIIVGCVYNPQTMPPYTLPDEKTKSTIKTNSSKGGGGFNELRFEDKKGSEQIFVHAEKDVDVRVKHDLKELVQNDRHLIVQNDQIEKVTKDKHLQVGGDHCEKIGATMSLNVTSDLQEKVGQNYALDAGMAVHIKAGMTAVIEAGTNVTLKVGGNFVSISPAGVTISGTMVLINSGGAAGSGAGCSPEAPKDPKEADNATAGQTTQRRQPPTRPDRSAATSLAAVTRQLTSAAQNGTPFCVVCTS